MNVVLNPLYYDDEYIEDMVMLLTVDLCRRLQRDLGLVGR